MKTAALVLACLLLSLGAVALAPSASAGPCRVTEPGCLEDFLGGERCIQTVPPYGNDLCWGG